jgi:hypothetical protein
MVTWAEIFHTLSTPVGRQMYPAGWVNIFLSPFWFSVVSTGVVEVWGTKSQKRPVDSERNE